MRELPKSVFGISAASLAVLVFTAGIVKVLWNELLVQSLSETAQRMSSGSASDFKSSAAVVAVGYVLLVGWSLAAALAWALIHAILAGRLSVAGVLADGEESPQEKLADAYCKIEFDVVGLGNEIHREFASALSEWKRSADYYVRLCLRYRESAIDELTEAISSQWHLRPSIEQVRDIASNGFAETISPSSKSNRPRKSTRLCSIERRGAFGELPRKSERVRSSSLRKRDFHTPLPFNGLTRHGRQDRDPDSSSPSPKRGPEEHAGGAARDRIRNR